MCYDPKELLQFQIYICKNLENMCANVIKRNNGIETIKLD